MARTSFIDAVSWSKLLIPRPAPVPGDASHRDSVLPRLCSWDLRSFRVCEAEPDGEPRDPLTEFLLVGATPGWRDVLPIAIDPPSKANRWEPIPTWEELALLNDTFDRRPPLTDEQERAQAEERHQERLRLREAGEMERVYRALDRERQEKRRAEVEAGLFWPRSATGQDREL